MSGPVRAAFGGLIGEIKEYRGEYAARPKKLPDAVQAAAPKNLQP
jgi:hypothetical protein